MSSRASSPAAQSDADSDTVGDEAAKDLEETIHQFELQIQQKVSEGGESSVGPAKVGAEGEESSEVKQKKSNLLAVRAAVRNGDMFSEEENIFGEKYLVSSFSYILKCCVTL